MGKIKPEKPIKSEAQRKEEREHKKKRLLKRARLILRNLSFECTEDDIKNHFSKFGNILEIKLLKKDGKSIGCGFIQFERKNNAAKAMVRTSGTDFMGRPVIVDWALSKDKFQMVNIKKEPQDDDEERNENSEKHEEIEVDQSIVKSEDETDPDESHDSGLDGSDESEDEEDEDPVPLLDNIKTEFKKPRLTVADESHTVFIKNLPFSATNEDLKNCAEEHGAVNYALVCIDPMTEHSKGTGFIQFKNVEIAKQVLEGKIQLVINGTSLIALKPMSKEAVQNANAKSKGPKDNRNLYLIKEGVILAGSPAANGVSNGDMMKRLQLDNWKNHKLKNLHMFVSPTRLVIHNLPSSYDDAQLKALFKNNSPKGSVITEARVMKNLKHILPTGKPKPIGYGFVAFTKHEDALYALRKINNNPDIFVPAKRPIIAFSIENRKALHVKEKRLLNSKLALSKSKEAKDEAKSELGQSKQTKRKRKSKSKKRTDQEQSAENSQNQGSDEHPHKKQKFNNKSTTHVQSSHPQSQQLDKHPQAKQKFNTKAKNKPNVQKVPPAENPPFAGVAAKFGSRKLRSKRELIFQQKQHFLNTKKFKKQNKISRKQKRARKQMSK